ncbi:hypothetical protein SDRG_09820 [Saprolegnia diclina VS20]|uniref:Transmembrane protein n=1 Tax=Saprolegnia diclina (strain VS20) TaxID=1156394 RepID=T0Q3W5_SAPDV|nr:hypothetical protein SDRG_09820 [Saprolegnia diclina VS20]EQC32494.1 hypothetical protein SDRG_09820 [Saprolegnia diclina VS20]|eukprot:XP_008613995.1 hypothetical protein SDRG_09820 [Saprolegnia diclina VS20]
MNAVGSADADIDEYSRQSPYKQQVPAYYRAASSSLTSTNRGYGVDTDVADGDQPIRRMPTASVPSTSKVISPRRSANVKSSLVTGTLAQAYGAVDATVAASVALSWPSAKDLVSSRRFIADHGEAWSGTRDASHEPLWSSNVVDDADANRSGRSSSRALLLSHSSRRLRDGSSTSLRSLPSSSAGGGYGAIVELSSLLHNDANETNDALDTGDVGTKGREWCCFLCSMLLHSMQLVSAQLTADTELMFLGHLGTRQLAGAGLARFWIYVPLSFLLSGVGGWRLLFAKGFWLQSALVVALLATPLLTCYYFHVDFFVGGTMLHPITRAFAKQYATLISPSILPLLASTVLMQYLIARRVVVPVAVMATLACATTIALHFLLVFGYQKWPGFGFDGSPYATMAALVLLLLLRVAYGGCCVGFGGLAWRRSNYSLGRLRVLWVMAVPAGIPSCLQSVVLTIFGAASAYTPATSTRRLDEGDVMDAGSQQAAAWVVTVCFFLLVLAFLRGAAATTAERMQLHLRRQDVARARHVLFVGAVYGGALGCLFATIVFKYGAPLLSLWTADAIVHQFCVDALPYLAACMALSSVRLVFAAGLTTLEKTTMLPFAANVDTWLIQVPLGLGLGIGLQLGVLGLWVARLTGELVHTMLLLYALMLDANAATDEAATPLLGATASAELDKTTSDEASSDNVVTVLVPTTGARDRSLRVAPTPVANVGVTRIDKDDVATAEVHLEAAPVHSPLGNDTPLPWVRRRSSDGSATWVVADDNAALSPISEEDAAIAVVERLSRRASLVSSSSDAPTTTVASTPSAIQWVRQESTVGAVQWVEEEAIHDLSASSPSTQDELLWRSSDVSSSEEATPRGRSHSLGDMDAINRDVSSSHGNICSALIKQEQDYIDNAVSTNQDRSPQRHDDALPPLLSASVPPQNRGTRFEEACGIASDLTDRNGNDEIENHDAIAGSPDASLRGNAEPVRSHGDSNKSQAASSQSSFLASLPGTPAPRALAPATTRTPELSTSASDDWIIAMPATDVDSHAAVAPKSTTAATTTSDQRIDSRPQSAAVQGHPVSTALDAQDIESTPPRSRTDHDAANSYVITIAPEVTRDLSSTADAGEQVQRSASAVQGVNFDKASATLVAPRPLSTMAKEPHAEHMRLPAAMVGPALLDKSDTATTVYSSRLATALMTAPATTAVPPSQGSWTPTPVSPVALTFAEPWSASMAEEAFAKRVLHPTSPYAQNSAASGANLAPDLARALGNATDEAAVSAEETTRRRHRSKKKKRGTIGTDTDAAEDASSPVHAPDRGGNAPAGPSERQQTVAASATGHIDAGPAVDHDSIGDMELSTLVSAAAAPPKVERPLTVHAPPKATESPSLQYGKRSKKLRARQERKHHSAVAPAIARPPAPQMQVAMKDELLLLCFQIELLKHLQAA